MNGRSSGGQSARVNGWPRTPTTAPSGVMEVVATSRMANATEAK